MFCFLTLLLQSSASGYPLALLAIPHFSRKAKKSLGFRRNQGSDAEISFKYFCVLLSRAQFLCFLDQTLMFFRRFIVIDADQQQIPGIVLEHISVPFFLDLR